MLGLPSLRATARLRKALVILIRHGFGEFVAKLELPCRAPVCIRRRGRGLSVWARIRLALEEYGPTAVKIGQAVSTRPDLIPPELALELTRLQERVPEEPYEAVAAVAERSLGTFLPELFSELETRPVAAASLSQVHRAVLRRDGSVVAVKIRRPDIDRIIRADLDLMDYLAGMAHRNIPALRKDNLPELASEVRKTILREIDFRNEARNILLFRKQAGEESPVLAPAVHADLCTEEVLVMEFVDGVRVDEFRGDATRRKALALAGVRGAARQMLDNGFFHADPHLGNIRVVTGPDGADRLYFLDWGMVGRLTRDMRAALVDYILAIVNQDARKVAKVALEMAVRVPPLLDFQKFQTDIMFVLERIHAPLERSANLGRFLLDLTSLCRSWGVHLRSDYVLMARALINIEGAGRVIDPDFDVVEGLRPIARDYELRRRSLVFSDRPIFEDLGEAVRTVGRLPGQASRVLGLAETGELSTELRVKDMELLVGRLTTTGNRLASALIVAALIIGSALVFVSDTGPAWEGLPLFGLAGFVLAFAFGLALVVHMMARDK